MRTTRLSFSPVDYIPEALRAFLARRFAEICGCLLASFGLAASLSLATWSARDPSATYAAEGAARNLLGRPGAAIADIFMQVFGIGSVLLVLACLHLGWKLAARGALPGLKTRGPAALVALIPLCGLISALPLAEKWPLPVGLGGFAGDAALRLPAWLFNQTGLLAYTAWLAALGLTACAAIAFALKPPSPDASTSRAEVRPQSKSAAGNSADDNISGDEPGVAAVMLGGLIHAFYMMRAALQRMARRVMNLRDARRGARFKAAGDPAGEAPQAAAAGRAGARRVEPVFTGMAASAETDHAWPAAIADQASGADGTGQDMAAQDMAEPYMAGPDAAAEPESAGLSRVTVPNATIRPGKRQTREAQPSLLDSKDYQLPPLALLAQPKRAVNIQISTDALEQNARLLEGVLEDFGVKGEIINVRPGPVVTLYELEPAPGVKSSRVIGLADDIARSMSAISARVAVVPGRNAIGIELPNVKRETVYFRELLASQDFEGSKFRLPLCLGKTIGGEAVIAELARMPHLLIAGTTGSGKSVAINTMILSLLYKLRPDECRLIMIDPKMLELSVYDGIPHLLTPVVTDPRKAVVALKWAVREMEDRYRKMSKLGVRSIDGFNARVSEAKAKGETITRTVQTGFDRETGEALYEHEEMQLEALPFIVVIIDEMADLMMVAGKDIEGAVQRLAQMARAAGIHVIMATQRPSVDVITGTIKANFPTRISFQVTSRIDSRTILGEQGAEQLLGQGDMLHMAGGGRISRIHGPFCSDQEVEAIVAHLKKQGKPCYLDEVTVDESDGSEEGGADTPVFDKGEFGDESGDLYDQAVRVVLRDKKCSTSYIQRRLQIGYNKAASLVERMEKEGIVGQANHAGKREILVETAE